MPNAQNTPSGHCTSALLPQRPAVAERPISKFGGDIARILLQPRIKNVGLVLAVALTNASQCEPNSIGNKAAVHEARDALREGIKHFLLAPFPPPLAEIGPLFAQPQVADPPAERIDRLTHLIKLDPALIGIGKLEPRERFNLSRIAGARFAGIADGFEHHKSIGQLLPSTSNMSPSIQKLAEALSTTLFNKTHSLGMANTYYGQKPDATLRPLFTENYAVYIKLTKDSGIQALQPILNQISEKVIPRLVGANAANDDLAIEVEAFHLIRILLKLADHAPSLSSTKPTDEDLREKVSHALAIVASFARKPRR